MGKKKINHEARVTRQGTAIIEVLEPDVELELREIPGGSFWMGAPKEELESQDRERPQHQVTVPSFYMGRYPITQAQWRIVASWEPVEKKLNPDPSIFKKDYEGIDRWQRPVEHISWEDAQEFCARLSKKTNKEYRLPTEAEWEYACRAVISGATPRRRQTHLVAHQESDQLSVTSGDLTKAEWNEKSNQPFHFGETISTKLANYDGRGVQGEYRNSRRNRRPARQSIFRRSSQMISTLLNRESYREQTTPVGYFQVANNFGLGDLHGNVWEWCEDDWHSNYDGAPADGSAWLSGTSRIKIVRGGSWCYGPRACRSAFRNISLHISRNLDIGFRVVCVAARTT